MKKEGGLVATSRINDLYHIRIVMRGFHHSSNFYHAIVTRMFDDAQIIIISQWKWLLDLQTKRKALDWVFKRYDEQQMKLTGIEDRLV